MTKTEKIPDDIWDMADDVHGGVRYIGSDVIGKRMIAAALWAERERWMDKIDGLMSDLDSAIEVAWNRGAKEWVRLNYPKHYAKFTERETQEKTVPE